MSALLWHSWPKQIRLVAKLLLQSLSFLINLSLFSSALFFFPVFLLLLLVEELQRLSLFFSLASSSSLLRGFSLSPLLASFGFDLVLQTRRLGFDLPL